jgi:hypothetical protein
MANPDSGLKETVKFSFAPPESRTFPFNGQTFSTEDGVAMTLMFQRNSRTDVNLNYIVGEKTLSLSVDRLNEIDPKTDRIMLLPVKVTIRYDGSTASFVFYGRETEDQLAAKLQDFFAIGQSAQAAGFDRASERISSFTKKLWGSFAGGDKKRSALPLKASVPTTELTYNIFALSFALQNQVFEKFRLCENPKTLHQSLMIIASAKEPTPKETASMSKVSFAAGAGTSRVMQDEILPVEAGGSRLCCIACELVHCAIDAHWADCLCCLLSCRPCFFDVSDAPARDQRHVPNQQRRNTTVLSRKSTR